MSWRYGGVYRSRHACSFFLCSLSRAVSLHIYTYIRKASSFKQLPLLYQSINTKHNTRVEVGSELHEYLYASWSATVHLPGIHTVIHCTRSSFVFEWSSNRHRVSNYYSISNLREIAAATNLERLTVPDFGTICWLCSSSFGSPSVNVFLDYRLTPPPVGVPSWATVSE